jgi:hypothetical protein
MISATDGLTFGLARFAARGALFLSVPAGHGAEHLTRVPSAGRFNTIRQAS